MGSNPTASAHLNGPGRSGTIGTVNLACIEALTFDVFGTLVDWEAGIAGAVLPILREQGVTVDVDDLLQAYGRAESAEQAGTYRPYREVLRRTLAGMAKDLGFRVTGEIVDVLVDSLPRWPLFGDTTRALRSLGQGRVLGVISNVDEDLFAPVRTRLGVKIQHVVTAESVRAYKPAPAPFEAMRARLREAGIPSERWLHVAQSGFHDIAPTRALGIACVHVRRDAGRRSHAAPEAPEGTALAELEVADLDALVSRLKDAAA